MREIDFHKVPGKGAGYDGNSIFVLDEPGPGGANHEYAISQSDLGEENTLATVSFQKGPIQEVGVNGVMMEDHLAILIDRLRAFQSGTFSNDHNQRALDACQNALEALQERTRDRLKRGVEGYTRA